MTLNSISKLTYRRFLLASQGLWPGPRFKGPLGAESALNAMQVLQLDPLTMVARSQDIAMYGRILDYKPAHLYKMAYEKRKAFDYGAWLAMYPMQEFPYWRAIMPRIESHPRFQAFKKNHPKAIQEVQATLRDNGPMSNRDFTGEGLKYWSYRGRKDSSLALFYSWLLGDVMITKRKGFDRIYDLRERVIPKEYDYAATVEEAEDFFATKGLTYLGMLRERRFRIHWADAIDRKISPKEEAQKLAELYDRKIIAPVHVEGLKDKFITLAENIPLLEQLESGRIPKVWKLAGPSTQDEVTLLAPLEMVSARGRAKEVFDFEYIWEVYKPMELRRWGYYTLPILYGDDLVARLDPKLDRSTNTLQILGFWLEDDTPVDGAFADALAKGLTRFARMIDAVKVDLSGVKPLKLKAHLKAKINL
jgi:uncharacterized protein YcaQ